MMEVGGHAEMGSKDRVQARAWALSQDTLGYLRDRDMAECLGIVSKGGEGGPAGRQKKKYIF